MGRWVDTVFVAHADLEAVGRALASVCAEEGMVVGPAPLPRKRHLVEPLQYDGALHNDLWAIALFPGAPGWTVIKSAPLMLLAESRTDDGAMRLARLCTMLGTSGFALHLHDGSNLVLAEATSAGEVVISGFDASAPGDPLVFLGQRIDEARVEPAFHRHPALAARIGRDRGADESADGSADDSADDSATRIIAAVGGANVAHCGNDLAVSELIEHRPLAVPGARVLHCRWPGPTRERFVACDTWDAWRAQVGGTR